MDYGSNAMHIESNLAKSMLDENSATDETNGDNSPDSAPASQIFSFPLPTRLLPMTGNTGMEL